MTSNAETLHGASMASLHKFKSRSSRHRDVMKSAGAAQVSLCTACRVDKHHCVLSWLTVRCHVTLLQQHLFLELSNQDPNFSSITPLLLQNVFLQPPALPADCESGSMQTRCHSG